MYRSPEMIDLYSNYPVNEKADIWVWVRRQTGIGEPIVLCHLNSCVVNKHYQLVGGVRYEQILNSGKLLREKTFVKFEVW